MKSIFRLPLIRNLFSGSFSDKKWQKEAHSECWLRQSRLRLLVALKRNLHSNSTTQPAETSSSSKISFSSSTISSSSPTISLSSSRILLSSLTLKQHIQILMRFLEIFDWNKYEWGLFLVFRFWCWFLKLLIERSMSED